MITKSLPAATVCDSSPSLCGAPGAHSTAWSGRYSLLCETWSPPCSWGRKLNLNTHEKKESKALSACPRRKGFRTGREAREYIPEDGLISSEGVEQVINFYGKVGISVACRTQRLTAVTKLGSRDSRHIIPPMALPARPWQSRAPKRLGGTSSGPTQQPQ